MRDRLLLLPYFFTAIRDYSGRKFVADLTAGLTLGVIALPLAMAFGIASGVTPEQGIYTGIIAGFLISFFGGTRLSIGGPTGAFVVIVYGIVQTHGVEKLAVCTMMAGVMLIVMGLLRVGAWIKYIPYPVTTGFTSGIAVIILLGQLKEFLGLPIEELPAGFLEKLPVLWSALPQANWPAFALAAGSLVFLRLWPRAGLRWVPGPVVVLFAATFLAWMFQWPVATIGSEFGGIPSGFPALKFPAFDFVTVAGLFQPALTIAILAAIESLLCAVVADGMTGDRHRSNTELVGQGIANLFSPLFGGIPATGAIARTATNIQVGGVSPVSGMIHAGTLLAIVLAAAPLAGFVPLAVLSAILAAVAIRMGDWRVFLRLGRIPPSDALVFLATFSLTVVFDLTIAVQVGMLLAGVLFIKRVTDSTVVARVDPTGAGESQPDLLAGKVVPDGVTIYRISGAFLFGAADKLEDALVAANAAPKVVVILMQEVTSVDATAINALEMLVTKVRARRGDVIICGAHTQPYFAMTRAGFLDRLGEGLVAGNLDDALAIARTILAGTAQRRQAS